MNKSSFSILVFFVILFIGAALAFIMNISFGGYASYFVFAITFFLAYVISASINIANQLDRAIVLRLGHFHALKGPGLFFIIPVIDTVPFWIDIRVITRGQLRIRIIKHVKVS